MAVHRKVRRPVTPDTIEKLIVLIGTGLTPEEACATDPTFPTRSGVWRYLQRNPNVDLTERWEDAARRSKRVRNEHLFFQMIEKIEEGMTVDQACRATAGFVRGDCIDSFLSIRPHLHERFEEAKSAARAKRRGYDKHAIVATIGDKTAKGGYDALLTSRYGKRSWKNVVFRLRRNPEFCEINGALAARRELRRSADHQEWLARRQRNMRRTDPLVELRAACARNDLYRKAAVDFGYSDDAEDVRMDAIVAMLEGKEMVKRNLIRAHSAKTSSRFNTDSLDDRPFGDDSPSRIEMLTSNDWSCEAFA